MTKKVLVVLGSPNSPTGELSSISKERLNFCKEIFKKDMMILCTGGWGEHFNTSKKPHAFLAKNYLIKKGISEDNFTEIALSKHTVDDAVKVKEVLLKLSNIELTIITSDYHLKRVTLIFNEILNGYKMKFIGVKSTMEKEKYNAFLEHEKKAINEIIKNGLYY